jgi:uncharacterized membrane protein SpoIIM required for sporulation
MVLESILKPEQIEKRPIEMIIFGFIIASIGLILALWVFPSYASFAMITFTVMATLPLMVKIMKHEKEKQEKSKTPWNILNQKYAISAIIFLFLGFLIAFSFWFSILPTDVTNKLFSIQINTFTQINNPSGAATISPNTTIQINSPQTIPSTSPGMSNPSGAAIMPKVPFTRILFNNLRVLALSILFSLIFCSGAIFILAWNASVLSVGMTNTIKLGVAAGGNGSANYFSAVSFSLIKYLIHGIPEIASYVVGGLAGGIISFMILDVKLNHKIPSKKFSNLSKGVLMLILIAIALLVIAAAIEVGIISIFNS